VKCKMITVESVWGRVHMHARTPGKATKELLRNMQHGNKSDKCAISSLKSLETSHSYDSFCMLHV